jgi:hypothetical protein
LKKLGQAQNLNSGMSLIHLFVAATAQKNGRTLVEKNRQDR